MPAVPALVMAGGAIGSSYLASKAQQSATNPSPAVAAATAGQTSAANTLAGNGAQMFGTGMPAVSNTLNYYRTLMGAGGRGAGQAAVAPAAQNIAANYKGAAAGLTRSGVQGGVRDEAVANLNKNQVGQTSQLLAGVQGDAASKAGALASGLVTGANTATGTAGSLYGNLAGTAQNQQQFGYNAGQGAGAGFGALLANLMNAYGRSGQGGMPSTGTGPLSGGYQSLAPAYGSTKNSMPYTNLAPTPWYNIGSPSTGGY